MKKKKTSLERLRETPGLPKWLIFKELQWHLAAVSALCTYRDCFAEHITAEELTGQTIARAKLRAEHGIKIFPYGDWLDRE